MSDDEVAGDVLAPGASPLGDENLGFEALKQAMTVLQSSLNRQFGIPNSTSTSNTSNATNGGTVDASNPSSSPASSAPRLHYQVGAAFSLSLDTEWVVVKGFVLRGILLQMAAEIGSEDPAALHVRLQAFATIGDLEFLVSAEIPTLQSGQDVDILFKMTLRRPAATEAVTGALQSITGTDNMTKPTSMIEDGSLNSMISQDAMYVTVQLRMTKPVGEPFSFYSLFCRFYAQINWRPQFKGSDLGLELVNCDFIFSLAKDVHDPSAPLEIMVRLYGTIFIDNIRVNAAVDFSRDESSISCVRFEIEALPGSLSAKDFLNNLPGNLVGSEGTLSKADEILSGIELPSGLAVLQNDLKKSSLKLRLAGSWVAGDLEYLNFSIFARQIDRFRVPFLDYVELRDLILMIEYPSWSVVLSGTMKLDNAVVSVRMAFVKGKGIYVRGVIRTGSTMSVARLARMDVFNDKASGKSMGLAGYAKTVKTGGDAPVDLAEGSQTTGYHVSFELLVLKQELSEKPTGTKKPEGMSEVGGTEGHSERSNIEPATKPTGTDGDKTVSKPDQPAQGSIYEIKKLKFLGHFGMNWQIVKDTIAFENLGICFDIRNPRTAEKRTIAGLIYGTWRLSKVDLYAYVLGRTNPKRTDFWAGLNVKRMRKGGSAKALDIVRDTKFTSSSDLTLPVQLPPDLKAKPAGEDKIEEGMAFDGRLLVHFSKVKEEDKSYKMEEVSLHIDVQSTFSVLKYKMEADASLDVRIIHPMDKEKRDFSCFFKGSLEFESDIYLQIEANIPMNNQKPKKDVGALEGENAEKQKKKLEPIEKHMNLKTSARAANKAKHLVDSDLENDDMVFLARVAKRPVKEEESSDNYESRLINMSEDLFASHDTSFRSLVSASYKGKADDPNIKNEINQMLPSSYPISSEKYQNSTNFCAVLVLRREEDKEGESKRRMKSLALTLASKEKWFLIDNKLWIQDVGLSLLIRYDKEQKRTISALMQGTIAFGDTMALTGMLTYDGSSELLAISAVAEISLSKIFSSMGTEKDTQPLLTDEADKAGDLMVGISVTLKKMKLDAYRFSILTLGEISISSSLALRNLNLAIDNKNISEKSDLTMRLSGQLAILGEDKKPKVTLDVTALSYSHNITIDITLQKVSPATIAKGVMEGGFDSANGDNKKPEFPAETGYAEWDIEKPTSSTMKTRGTIVFVKDGISGGRRFDSAKLVVVLFSGSGENDTSRAWNLIGEYITLKDLALILQIRTEKGKKAISGSLDAKLFLKLRERRSKVSIQPETLTLTVESSKATLALEVSKDRTVGDFLFALTSGILDVPDLFDLPAFPRIQLSYDWKQGSGTLTALFEREGGAWRAPLIKDIMVENPCLKGQIQRKGNKSTKVSIKGKLNFLKLVKLDVEYVLLGGPLLIEDYDVKKIIDMVRKIWRMIKDALRFLKDGAKTVAEFGAYAIGEGLGFLVGALALGGPFIVGITGWVIGGILAGAAWLAAKLSLVGLLRELADKGDRDEIERGFRDALAPMEGGDSSGSRDSEPLSKRDDPRCTLNPPGVKDVVRRVPVDKDSFVEITGSGTSAGMAGQLAEFFLEAKYTNELSRVFSSHILPEGQKLNPGPSVSLDVKRLIASIEPNTEGNVSAPFKDMVIGRRYRISWKRPGEPCEISVKATPYRLPIQSVQAGSDPAASSTKSWSITSKGKPEELISPEKSTIEIPKEAIAGGDILGYIFLRDPEGNVRQGLDERDQIIVHVTGGSYTTKLSRRQNGYVIHTIEALKVGKLEVAVTLANGKVPRISKVSVFAVPNLDSLWICGTGACNGFQEEKNVEIRIVDHLGIMKEKDTISASLNYDGNEREIPLLRVTETQVSSYTGKYNRPSVGDYTISILINGTHHAESPLKLTSSAAPIFVSLSHAKIAIPRARLAAGEIQSISIQLFDSLGCLWRAEDESLKHWKLEALSLPADEDDGVLSSRALPSLRSLKSAAMWELERPSDSPPGLYVVPAVSLHSQGRYKFCLRQHIPLPMSIGQESTAAPERSDFKNASEAMMAVTAYRTFKRLLLSGDGLQTGNEGTVATVDVRALDQYGEEMALQGPTGTQKQIATLRFSLINGQDGKEIGGESEGPKYKHGSLLYTRPRANGPGSATEYFLRVWAEVPGDVGGGIRRVVAKGSPFLIRSVHFFDNVNETMKPQWISKGVANGKPSRAALIVRDQYGSVTWTAPTLAVAESKDYKIHRVVRKPDSLFYMSFTPTAEFKQLKYYLEGDCKDTPQLPPLAVWQQRDPALPEPVCLLRKPDVEQQVATLNSRESAKRYINSEELQAMLYPASPVQQIGKGGYIKARVVARDGVEGVYDVKATFQNHGDYILRLTYYGLLLAGDYEEESDEAEGDVGNHSFDLRVRVSHDAYLGSESDMVRMTMQEREFVTSPANLDKYYGKFMLSAPIGNIRTGKRFSFLESDASLLDWWPTRLVFNMAPLRDQDQMGEDDVLMRLARVSVTYAHMGSGDNGVLPTKKVIYGCQPNHWRQPVVVDLDITKSERVNRVRIYTPEWDGHCYISKLMLETTLQKKYVIPVIDDDTIGEGDNDARGEDAEGWYDCAAPKEMTGLKGFWGRCGEGVDRLGAIWGK